MFSYIKMVLLILCYPMVLTGLVVSYYFLSHYGLENYRQILGNPNIYGVLWLIALLYALFFKHIYKLDSDQVDWWATFKSSFGHLAMMIVTIIIACSIYYVADDNWSTKIDRYARNQKAQDTLPTEQVR